MLRWRPKGNRESLHPANVNRLAREREDKLKEEEEREALQRLGVQPQESGYPSQPAASLTQQAGGGDEEDEGWLIADTPPTPPSVTSEECRAVCASAGVDLLFQRAKLRLTCPPRWRRLFLAAGRRNELTLHRLQEALLAAISLDDLATLEILRAKIPASLYSWWSYELDIYLRAVRRLRPDMLLLLPEMQGIVYPSQFAVKQIWDCVKHVPQAGPASVQRRQHGEMVLEVVRSAMERKSKIDINQLKLALEDPLAGPWKNRPSHLLPLAAAGVNYSIEVGQFRGWTPLHFVTGCIDAGETALEALELLVEAKADATLKDASGGTCLHLAALLNHLSMVDPLLKYGVPVEEPDIEGSTALMVAARTRHEKIVKAIVYWTLTPERAEMLDEAEKVLMKYSYARGQELLRQIASNDHSAVKRLIMEGDETGGDLADLMHADAQGRKAIHHAIQGIRGEDQCTSMIRLLVSLKADVNCIDFFSTTPLHLASFLGRHEVCRILLRLKAHPGVVDAKGRTPLMIAAAANSEEGREPPPYNGTCVNEPFAWGTIEGVMKWDGLGGQPSGLILRPPGPAPPEDPREILAGAFGKTKRKKVKQEEEEAEDGDEEGDGNEEEDEEELPVEEKKAAGLSDLELAKARGDILCQLGFDDQEIIDTDNLVNRGDRLQIYKHIFYPAGDRIHGIDALMVKEKHRHRLKPVEKRARVLWDTMISPLLQLQVQNRLNSRLSDFLKYLLWCMLGKRGLVFGRLSTASTVKPGTVLPIWKDIQSAINDVDDLEDRVEAVRVLGFRGPKPRKTCWVGAVWAVDEYPRNPDSAPWTAFQYVEREDADVLGRGATGLHGEAFKNNRLWALENSTAMDHKEATWEEGVQKKDNEVNWEASPGFNWSGAVTKLPIPNRFDKIQLANRLFIDEGLTQRRTMEQRIKLVGEKLLCPLLVESAESLAQPNVGLWSDGGNMEEDDEAEKMAMHRDLLRYVAAQITAFAGNQIGDAKVQAALKTLRKSYADVFDAAKESIAVALATPQPPEFAQLTDSGDVYVPYDYPPETLGPNYKRSQFEPKDAELDQAMLIPESETLWYRKRHSTQAYVKLRLCGSLTNSKDFLEMCTALNREQPQNFAEAFWKGSYGLMLWGRGRQLRPSLDLALRRRLVRAKWPEEEGDDESSEEEDADDDMEDDEEEGNEPKSRKKKEKPVPQFILNGPRLAPLADVLRMTWATGDAGKPSKLVQHRPGEQPLLAGPTGMLRTEIVCRNMQSLIAAFEAITGPPPVEEVATKDPDEDFMLDESESEQEESEEEEETDDEEVDDDDESQVRSSAAASVVGAQGFVRAEVRAKRRAPIGKPAKIRVVRIINGFHPDKASTVFSQAAGILLLVHVSARKSLNAHLGHGEKEVDYKQPLTDDSDLVQQLVEVELLLDSSVEARWLENFTGLEPSWLERKRQAEQAVRDAAIARAKMMKQKIG